MAENPDSQKKKKKKNQNTTKDIILPKAVLK